MTAVDQFSSTQSFSGPCSNAVAVTPSDSNELTVVSRAIYVGSGGTLVVITNGGQTTTLAGVPAGAILPLRVKQVLATGTTASSIVNLY